jgi:membrane fusion protein (multidrug efflux system)
MENSAPQNNKKRKIIFFSGIAVCLLAVFLSYYIIHGFSRISTDDAYITGRIHSIAAKIPGTVKKVYVDDNQSVKKGGLLVEIDPPDYELKVKEAQAALESEKARVMDAGIGIKSAQVSFSQVFLDKQRGDALYNQKVIPKEKHEKIVTAYNLAATQLKAAKERKTLEESLVKEREVSLNMQQLYLSYTKIFAPSDGYITNKSAEAGNQIQANQPLMAVVALDDIWVVANYKETQLKSVLPGQRVEIKVDTYPGKVFTGRVDSIMAGTGAVFSLFPPENALGNYVKIVQRIPVKIVFDKTTDERHVLRIGMSCVPVIITKDE